jgi:WD repeat-containing protein 61
VVIECPPAENWKLAFAPGDAPARLACAAGASESVKLYALDDADTASEPKAEYKLPVRGDGEGARKGKGNFAHSIAFSPDGASLACGAADGRVAIFDVASGKVARTLEGHSMPVRDLVFSPDGRTLYTACDDGHAHAYDAHHGSLLDALPGHKSWVLGVAATSDGRGLVTVGADAKTKLWDVAQRQCVQTATEQGQAVWGVSVSAGKVACVSDDKSVCLYEYAE